MVELELLSLNDECVAAYRVTGDFVPDEAEHIVTRAAASRRRLEFWDFRAATFDWEYHVARETVQALRPGYEMGVRVAIVVATRDQFRSAHLLQTVAETEWLNATLRVFRTPLPAITWLLQETPRRIGETLPPRLEFEFESDPPRASF